ncbi:MAG: hypothetical protein WBF90_06245 [Rivularia sp. (in: cyanobacteria)]|jgi:hypothetical protein
MLQSYEAIMENGQIQWLKDIPKVSKARVIVTIISDVEPQALRRTPAASIAGKGKTLGDVVTLVEETDWECLK